MGRKFIDLTGKRFGKLIVIEKSNIKKFNKIQWLCKCDCGNLLLVKGNNLTTSNKPTKSCGCIKKELNKTRSIKHNKRHSRLYPIWASIKQRCYNEKCYDSYKYYGGRGITMCDEWKNNFMSFYNWSMENGYNENARRGKCTIDRIDVNGNYEPNNCRWVDMKIQANNTRKTQKKYNNIVEKS